MILETDNISMFDRFEGVLLALFVEQKMPDSYSELFSPDLILEGPFSLNFSRPSYLTRKQSRVLPKGATSGYRSF